MYYQYHDTNSFGLQVYVPGSKVGELSVEIINEVSDGIIDRFTGVAVIEYRLQQVYNDSLVIELQQSYQHRQ